jgi:ABC-type glycerol-3-phosphate transport system substrate-binding protein
MDTSHMNRRNFLQAAATTAGVATLGGALAACGSTSTSTGPAVTINEWDILVSQSPYMNNEVKLFQQAHPDIKVKRTIQVTDTYANLLALAIKSNKEPDFFGQPGTPTVNDLVARGWALPLDKWATATWRAKFPPASFYEGNNIFNGKLYSAPTSGNAPWLQLYINNAVFRQAGLVNKDGSVKIPKTWNDVSVASDAIVKKSGGASYGLGFGNGQNFILAWWLELFVRGAGGVGGAYSQDYRTGKWTYATSRAYTDFIDLLLEWKNKGYIYPDAMSSSDEEARAFFERGKFGMTVGGTWNQVEWTQHNFTDYSLMTLPTPNAKPEGYFTSAPGGTSWFISAKAKDPDACWAWFDWLTGVDAAKRSVQMGEGISVYPQANNPSLAPNKIFAQYLQTTSLDLPGPNPPQRNPAAGYVVQASISPDINDVLAGIYTGQISDIQSSLSDLAGRYLDSFNKGLVQAQQQGHKVSFSDFVFPDWNPLKPYITKPDK